MFLVCSARGAIQNAIGGAAEGDGRAPTRRPMCVPSREGNTCVMPWSASDLSVRLVRVWYLCPMRLCAVIQNPDNVEEMRARVCAEVAPPHFAEPADGPQIGHVS